MLRNLSTMIRCTIAALLLTVGMSFAWAYQVAPMIYDLTPSGPGSTSTIRVKNDGERPITIELVAEKRTFDENGKESRVPADDDFILFPPQAVVAPGKTQAVRVQYVGTPDLKKSVMYSVTVKQVPVALPTTGPSGVQFVFNFGTVANVVPAGAKPAVEVVAMTPLEGGYKIRLRNSGTRYANLSLGRLMFRRDSGEVALEGDAWHKALGASWLLPDGERVITVPALAGLSGASKARFEPGSATATAIKS